MEDRPRHIQGPLHVERQQSDEDEHHLTGIHVAEQTQREAERLGQQAETLEEQVERHQRPVVERSERPLLAEATESLDLEAVEEDHDEIAARMTEGNVRVGGCTDSEYRTEATESARQ